MDNLSTLLKTLNHNDRTQFKHYLVRKNKRTDVKNIQLLDLIETDDIEGVNKLYNAEKNKDAYHALRKRLQDSLLLFLSQKIFENDHSESYDALRLLVVSRFLLENDVAKVAFKCLNKAERLAESLEQYNLLNELLLLKLQYAHLPGAETLESLSKRFQSNQSHMQLEAKLNMAYAFLRLELQEINLRGKVVNLTNLMILTIRKYKISTRDLMSYKSIYQILVIANEYAAIQQDYRLIERYVKRSNQFIEAQGQGRQSHLFYHISILYFLANYQLRRKDFAASRSYLEEMRRLMETDSQYATLFNLRYQLISALNLFYTGSAPDAISTLQGSLSGTRQGSKPEELEDLRICLTMCLALCDDRTALKQLRLLTQSDAWYEKKMGMLWTIRKNLMEILIQAQFSNIELAMSRLNSFRRRYRKYLLNTSEQRVLLFLKLVERYLNKPDVAYDERYRDAVYNMLGNLENSDIFNLSFIAWLIGRWEKKGVYAVVLKLIQEGSYS